MATCSTVKKSSVDEQSIDQSEHPELLYLDVSINGVKQTEICPIVRIGKEIWFSTDQLPLLNLKDSIDLVKKRFFNKNFVLLPPWVSTEIDVQDLLIAIDIPPEYMSVTILHDEPKLISVSPSTYAFYWNYDLLLHHQPLINHAQFMTAHQPVFTTPYGSLRNQFMTKLGSTNNIVLLEISYMCDFPSYQLRLIAGDFATDTPSFISPVAAVGLKLSKGLLFQAGSLSYPTMSFSGFISRPAEAEIWINDRLRIKKDIPMGGFVLDNINLPLGPEKGQLLIKDSKGIVSSIPFSYYGDPEILRPGLSSYSYSLGFLRKNYGTKSFSYGVPAIFGSHRIGVSNFWTPSFHVQLSPKSILFGLEQRLRLFSFGSTGIAAVATASSYGFGFLISPQLQLDIWRTNFRTRAIFTTADYTPVSVLIENTKSPSISLTSMLRLDLPYIKYSSVNHLLMTEGKSIEHTIGLRQQVPVYNEFNMNLSADYNIYHHSFGFFAFLSYQISDRHTAMIETTHRHNQLQAITSLNASFDPNKEHKLSYGVSAGLNNNIFGQGNVNFENRHLRSNLNVLGSKNSLAYLSGFAGSFQIIKSRLFFSAPVGKSIALIELPGQSEIKILQNSSKVIGKTDGDGFLLIPDLIPYENTRLNIDFKDLSLFTNSEQYNNDIMLTPGFQTAHTIKLTSKMVRHLHFRLMQNQENLLPGTRVTINGRESFVMNDGSIYLDVPEDESIISGKDEFDKCRFEIQLPKKTDAIIEKINNIDCQAMK